MLTNEQHAEIVAAMPAATKRARSIAKKWQRHEPDSVSDAHYALCAQVARGLRPGLTIRRAAPLIARNVCGRAARKEICGKVTWEKDLRGPPLDVHGAIELDGVTISPREMSGTWDDEGLDASRAMAKVVRFLRRDELELLHQRYWLDMTCAEIGVHRGVSRESVRKAILRLISKIRRRLGVQDA